MGLEFEIDINLANGHDGVNCPLINAFIQESNCIENAMIVSGFMNESIMISKFKQKENWKEICKNCDNFTF